MSTENDPPFKVIRGGEVIREIPATEAETAAQLWALDLQPGDILDDGGETVLVKEPGGGFSLGRRPSFSPPR